MKPKRTILCVDDNEQSLSIRKVLLETRGYRVAACKNTEEAMDRFRMGDVDLVLTRLSMPGVDGSKLIEAVKELSRRLLRFYWLTERVLMITAAAQMCS